MTAAARSHGSALPHWLVDAVMGLVAAAYDAGRAERVDEPQAAQPAASTKVLLSRWEAADLLRCGTTKLDGLVHDGVIPSFRLGGRRMFRADDLHDYLKTASSDPAPTSPSPG